ncbi:MAG TPA: (2Fe-2S) ferredoxin domain-containing protein [Calditrichaeota bacterium]|nr:(2Fe-2S) ferredoxin domain-containing protein [Calditrichota bacterium]
MSQYKKHVFICENIRDAASGRAFCGSHRTKEQRDKLKVMVKAAGIGKDIRINSAGCLGQCSKGPVMVIYPQGLWYGQFTDDDLEEILQKSILGDQVIDRFIIEK